MSEELRTSKSNVHGMEMDEMTSTKLIFGKCSQCGVETEHDIVPMHTDGIGFGLGMECPVCGKLVPEQAWTKYQRTGDVVVPNIMRKASSQRTRGTKEYK